MAHITSSLASCCYVTPAVAPQDISVAHHHTFVVHLGSGTAARKGLCGAPQIAVQVGNVSASLGDRLWATWFSSAKEYARATTPIAIIRVNVQVQQGYPQP